MPVRFVQNAIGSANPTTTLTKAYGANVVSGNLLLCYCWQGNDSTDDTSGWTVTDTIGNTYTRFAHSSETSFAAGGATGSKQALFAAISKSAGANTISVGFGASKLYGRMAIWEYSGSSTPASSAILDSAADSTFHFSTPIPYFYRTAITAVDPGAGNMRLNNATLSAATQVYLDSVDAVGNNRDSRFTGFPTTGIKLRFFQDSTPANYVEYTVTSITNNTGWWTVGVTYIGAGGTISQVDNTAWWGIFYWNDDTVAPSVRAVAGGRVGAAMQQLEGSSGISPGSYVAGTGMQNLIITAVDGYLASADLGPSAPGLVTPAFGNLNFSPVNGTTHAQGSQFGMSWSIAPLYPMIDDDAPVGTIGRGAGW